jgi:hypothetical protein
MSTNVTGNQVREYTHSSLHYYRRTIAFDTPAVGVVETIDIGTLPAGAVIYDAIVKVNTPFNAAGDNLINVGIAGTPDAIVDETDIDATSAEFQSSRRGCDLSFAVDTPIFATYTQSGTAATAGEAEIIVLYVPDNDR